MAVVRPVEGWLVRPEWADLVVSPPYDALTPAERVAWAARNPYTYLHVTRSPEDADGEASDPVALAHHGREAVDRLLDAGAYRPVGDPAVFLYRLATDDHTQTGIVVDLAVTTFEDGTVRGHEAIRPDRAGVLAEHLDHCGATSSPVAIMHRPDPALQEAVAAWATAEPELDFDTHGVLRQTVWRVDDPDALAVVTARIGGHHLYITDGHHRAAAAGIVHRRRAAKGGVGPGAAHNFVLVVLFPVDELTVGGFHRRIAGPVDGAAVRAGLEPGFLVERAGPTAVDRPAPGVLVARLDGHWYRLVRRVPVPAPGVAGLDVTVLHREVLEAVLGLGEADARIEFVSGRTPADQVSVEDGGAVFATAPPTLDQVIEVADRGEVMPPKSTYFDPKPRSGVFLRFR